MLEVWERSQEDWDLKRALQMDGEEESRDVGHPSDDKFLIHPVMLALALRLDHPHKPCNAKTKATFSDLQRTSTFRMAQDIIGLNDRHRHTI